MNRLRILYIAVYACCLLLVGSLFCLQVFQFKYFKSLSLKNTIRIIPIEASRGGIYDRNRDPIAVDKISFDIIVIPQEIKDIQETAEKLSKIAGIDRKILISNYKKNYYLPFVPVKIATNLNRDKAFHIDEKLSEVKGALISASPQRYYENNEIGSHVIGYVSRIASREFKKLKDYGYKIQDLVGKSGIEKYYDAYLKGEGGGIQIEVDAESHIVKTLGFKQPIKGKDLRLTIDLKLQRFVDMMLQDRIGSCVVMDTKTGAILALSSAPEFDPNIFVEGSSSQRLKLLRDKRRALLDRAISCAYPCGSIFKVIIASCGLDTNSISKDTKFLCKGSFHLGGIDFGCWKKSGHGQQDIVEAIAHSCNVFFYNLGRLLGAEKIQRFAQKFGLGNITGIDLPGETKGLVPGPFWKRFSQKEPWYTGDTINYSIGQGYLLVTPIQFLQVITVIANEGYSHVPYLVEEIEGKKLSHKKPLTVKLKKDIFKIIKKGLFDTVNSRTGTGQNAKVSGLKLAGKTGTAQAGKQQDTHAWFIGYMPAEDPKVSFVIFLEHGGQGGIDPAHMAKILGTYMKNSGFL